MNKIVRTAVAIAFFASSAPLALAHASHDAKAIVGRWNASLSRDGTVIPFRLASMTRRQIRASSTKIIRAISTSTPSSIT